MKIICIGRNYVDHIQELDPDAELPAEPVFFLKPDSALLRNNDPFFIPSFSNEIHYETELVVRINRVAKCIEERFAHRCYNEVTLGVDFTARDLQRRCIAGGLPWEICKGFDRSAAIAPRFIPLSELGKPVGELTFTGCLNGEVVQRGDLSQLIFSVDRLISYVSQFMTLKIGDLLFTGTPAGVGTVAPGDHYTAQLEGMTMLDFKIK